jgi:hypothetical protein
MASYLYRGATITTLDIDPVLGGQQPESARGDFVCADARNLPFPDGCFAVVTLFDVLEHIEEDSVAVQEALRVTRKAGYVLVSTPHADWHYPFYPAMQRVCPQELELMREWGHVRRGYSHADLALLFGDAPQTSRDFRKSGDCFFPRRCLLPAAEKVARDALCSCGLAYRYRVHFARDIDPRHGNRLCMAAMRDGPSEPTIVIFPWGDVIEEFLDPIGLTVEDFVDSMSGGWLFGYVTALQHAGWRPIIACGSERKNTTIRLIHSATGAPVWMVPASRVIDARAQRAYTAAASIRRWLATPMRLFRDVIEREQCRALMIQEYEYTRFDALVRLATRVGIRSFTTFQGGDQTLSWIEGLIRGRSLSMCSGLVIASETERLRVERLYAGHHPRSPIYPIQSTPRSGKQLIGRKREASSGCDRMPSS